MKPRLGTMGRLRREKKRDGPEFIKKGSTDKYLILSLDRAAPAFHLADVLHKEFSSRHITLPSLERIVVTRRPVIIWNAIIIQPKKQRLFLFKRRSHRLILSFSLLHDRERRK